jgi:hypothetical protein
VIPRQRGVRVAVAASMARHKRGAKRPRLRRGGEASGAESLRLALDMRAVHASSASINGDSRINCQGSASIDRPGTTGSSTHAQPRSGSTATLVHLDPSRPWPPLLPRARVGRFLDAKRPRRCRNRGRLSPSVDPPDGVVTNRAACGRLDTEPRDDLNAGMTSSIASCSMDIGEAGPRRPPWRHSRVHAIGREIVPR